MFLPYIFFLKGIGGGFVHPGHPLATPPHSCNTTKVYSCTAHGNKQISSSLVDLICFARWRLASRSQALHCGKAYVQSQCERANLDLSDIKIPEIFQIRTWHPWLRPGVLHECKFAFQFVQWGFTPHRWNVTVLWY